MNNIKSVFNNDKDKKIFLIRNYSNDDDEIALIDLNKSYLNYQPNKHTIIIIKEKIRCSYTINKTHIGILYERKAETVFQNETTIIQGFLGRACGYYDNSNRNIIIYTNLNIVHNYLLKIKNEHEKELYKIKKNKKIINDKDINYNITSCITDITFDIKNKKIKEYNIKVIKDHDIDIENELINGINKKDVYNKIIFDKILKNNNYYDIFYQHDNTYKRTSNENITEKIKEAINNKTYIDYKDITGINKSQCKKITESLKSIIVVVNSRQNEIYLLHYYKDT
jgi:hypothetical protein